MVIKIKHTGSDGGDRKQWTCTVPREINFCCAATVTFANNTRVAEFHGASVMHVNRRSLIQTVTANQKNYAEILNVPQYSMSLTFYCLYNKNQCKTCCGKNFCIPKW